MKKMCKYLTIIGLYILSFYYTEQVALYVKHKNPIYTSIEALEKEKYVSSTDSIIIDDTYIIPGLNGRNLNVDASFRKMKKEMEEELFVYNPILPSISLEENKDKIIIRGNSKKNAVALLFYTKSNALEYTKQKGFKVNFLLTKEEYDSSYEMINYAHDTTTYSNIDRYLTKNKWNTNICIVNKEISTRCLDKYAVKPSLIMNHSNFSEKLNTIQSGEIIAIENSLTLEEMQILLDKISYKNLNILPLSKLISEA